MTKSYDEIAANLPDMSLGQAVQIVLDMDTALINDLQKFELAPMTAESITQFIVTSSKIRAIQVVLSNLAVAKGLAAPGFETKFSIYPGARRSRGMN